MLSTYRYAAIITLASYTETETGQPDCARWYLTREVSSALSQVLYFNLIGCLATHRTKKFYWANWFNCRSYIHAPGFSGIHDTIVHDEYAHKSANLKHIYSATYPRNTCHREHQSLVYRFCLIFFR